MYSVTYIISNKLFTVTHPQAAVMWDVYTSLLNCGYTARMWDKNKNLFQLEE